MDLFVGRFTANTKKSINIKEMYKNIDDGNFSWKKGKHK
jgi:hypothetical protein